jgi:hypothetical protein
MAECSAPEDRQLIEALMLQGWYRDGQDLPDDAGKSVWRVRSGHCLEALQRTAIGVRARSQHAAMQELLRYLRRQDVQLVAPDGPPL